MEITSSSEKSFLERMTNRFSSYTAVGISTFVFDLILIGVLVSVFDVTEPLAIGAAFLIAVHINYTILRLWVYRASPEKLPRTYIYFMIFALAFTFIIPTIVMWLSSNFAIDIFYGRIAMGGINGLVGFLFNTFLNFRLL